MRTEQGTIEQAEQNRAQVRIERSASCSQCESRGSCQTVGSKSMVIDVSNSLHAKVGDRVEIGVPTHSFLKFSLMVYLLPVMALIIGAILGEAWGPSLGLESSLSAVLVGGLAMGLTFTILRRFDRSAREKKDYQPVMTRIILSAESLSRDDNR